ncbi:uncharacterized protein LOC115431889 isoform X2 [Sphaeramia orbicularis]|uniref:uncharacterized protein LOC115431889 isoform X2 n=1 Tax=Sphaeramia orbicularis TaxID=375764 RepID=UPI0011801128|nr:uncharacterized protein LOC115431889 isoform X2 [Sphaeramia orbicularis]
MFLIQFTWFFLLASQDFVSCANTTMTVELGATLTLNCTYNCASGFVRGCWKKTQNDTACLGHGSVSQGMFCTVSLHLSNVSIKDLDYTYTCFTVATDHPQLRENTERTVLLLQEQTSSRGRTVTHKNHITNTSPKDPSGGEFNGMKVLAAVTIAVAMVLAALAMYLCLNCSRQSWNGQPLVSMAGSPRPSPTVLPPVKGSLSTQSERPTLRIPTPDNESDTEVPYADIMITVRGVSTPELTQVGYLNCGEQKEWWGDECHFHLQASRSADRLHVPQPREVSRKMSTNSEYAVITYA